jgi:hypothetical protein
MGRARTDGLVALRPARPVLLAVVLWAVLGAGSALGAAPVVSITSPASGATVSGTVTFSATATSANAIASVEFRVDGAMIAKDTTKPYSVAWNTTTVAGGSRRLAAVALDTRGNRTTVSRTVTVSNSADTTAPTVAFGAPASGATVGGAIEITATASDPSGVASVRFAVDGQALSTDTTSPYAHVGWNTAAAANGTHTLSAVATDTRGNARTVTRAVTTSNDLTGPALAFTAPAAGVTVSGAVDITATASDVSGVAGVTFLVDGSELSTDTAAPYIHGGWDTTLLPDGEHTITLIATDALGNATTLTRTVNVAGPTLDLAGPELALTTPEADAVVSGFVDIAATASDPSGVAGVTFLVDGDVVSTDTAAPYAHSGWDTSFLGSGPYVISAVATDLLGFQTTATRTVTVPPTVGPPPSSSGSLPGVPLRRADLETGDLTQFDGLQQVAADRIQVVASPVAEGVWAARFEVRLGDQWQSSTGNRAEVVIQTNEIEGDERWYQWNTMFAPDYPFVDTGFQIVTQWHATAGSSQPMLILFASGDHLGFKTVESTADLKPTPSVVHWRGPLKRGSWHAFRLHVVWSANPAVGSVELWHNGVKVVGPVSVATMIPGQGVYLKQGLYRSATHTAVGVVHHDGLVMSEVG